MWEFLGQGSNLRRTAATRATAVRTQEPQPARSSENSLKLNFNTNIHAVGNHSEVAKNTDQEHTSLGLFNVNRNVLSLLAVH